MTNPKNIFVTTTSTIEGSAITRYIKPISAHIVAGAGFWSDILASFTDLSGGRSSSYERKLSSIYKQAIENLKTEAFNIGANAIIGLHIDFDEISGKTKEMFMITALGTAVVIETAAPKNKAVQAPANNGTVSIDSLRNLFRRKSIITSAENGTLVLDEATWNFIIANQLVEVFWFLIKESKKLIGISDFPESFNSFWRKIALLFSDLDDAQKIDIIYGQVDKENNTTIVDALCELVKSLLLFDADRIIQVMQMPDFEKQKAGLKLLKNDKPYFDVNDVERLEAFIPFIEGTFIERGKRSLKKQLLSSKEKEVWTCECSKVNDIDFYCSGCGKDIFGFKQNDLTPKQVISYLETKIALLRECLNS